MNPSACSTVNEKYDVRLILIPLWDDCMFVNVQDWGFSGRE